MRKLEYTFGYKERPKTRFEVSVPQAKGEQDNQEVVSADSTPRIKINKRGHERYRCSFNCEQHFHKKKVSYVDETAKRIQDNKAEEQFLRFGNIKTQNRSKSPIKKFDKILEFRQDDMVNINFILQNRQKQLDKKRKAKMLWKANQSDHSDSSGGDIITLSESGESEIDESIAKLNTNIV